MRKAFRVGAAFSVLCAVLALVLVNYDPASAAPGDPNTNFSAYLTGANETPGLPVQTVGMAYFHVNGDGDSLSYSVTIPNVTNVAAGHIHLGVPGQSGPVVAFLYMSNPGSGAVNVNATGTITAKDLVGPLKDQPMSALIKQLSTNAYVNFHTDDGVMPANTGQGDFPGGETRGQIKSADTARLNP